MAAKINLVIVWIASMLAFVLALWLGDAIAGPDAISANSRGLLKAVLFSGLIVPFVLWFHIKREGKSPTDLGLQPVPRSISGLLIGFGIMAAPLIITLGLSSLLGWADIQTALLFTGLDVIFIALLTVFLFEALPEELISRGYIYNNLSTDHKKWTAIVGTVALFVLFPIVLAPISNLIFGTSRIIGDGEAVSVSYLIILTLFGFFQMYLRIISGGIWVGVGFHIAFVYLDRLIGPDDTSPIQIAGVSNGAGMATLGGTSAILTLGAVFVYPWLKRRRATPPNKPEPRR